MYYPYPSIIDYTAIYVINWLIFFGIWFGISFVLAYLVYRNAKHSRRRDLPPIIWFLIVFLTNIIGVLIYLLIKQTKRG